MGTFEIILGAVIGLFISYFVIRGAVKDALTETMEAHLKVQSAILKHQAKQAGMSDEQIDRAWMNDKQYKKKYPVKK